RLRELAEHLRVRAAGDLTDGDPRSLLGEVENAISALESDERRWEQGMPEDPADHRETLSPDSDELEEIEEEDEESIEDDIVELDDDEDAEEEGEDEGDEDDENDEDEDQRRRWARSVDLGARLERLAQRSFVEIIELAADGHAVG